MHFSWSKKIAALIVIIIACATAAHLYGVVSAYRILKQAQNTGVKISWHESSPSIGEKIFEIRFPEVIVINTEQQKSEHLHAAIKRLDHYLESMTIDLGNSIEATQLFDLACTLPKLRTLQVFGCNLSDESLTKLLALKHLRHLSLTGSNNKMSVLPKTEVETLELDGSPVETAGFKSALMCPKLQHLSVTDTKLTYEDFNKLDWPPNTIKTLSIGYLKCTDAELVGLSQLICAANPHLTQLHINNGKTYLHDCGVKVK